MSNKKQKMNAINQIWNQEQIEDTKKSNEFDELNQNDLNNTSMRSNKIKSSEDNKSIRKTTFSKDDVNMNVVTEEDIEKLKKIVKSKKRTTRIIFRINNSLNKRINDFCEKYNFIKGKVCRIAILNYIKNVNNLQNVKLSGFDNLLLYKDDLEKKDNTFQFLIDIKSAQLIDNFCQTHDINRSNLCIKSLLTFINDYEAIIEKQKIKY